MGKKALKTREKREIRLKINFIFVQKSKQWGSTIYQKSSKTSFVTLRMNVNGRRYKKTLKCVNKYMFNPLIAFEPICNYTGSWSDYIDWHSVEELLWRLDFRRKFVFTVANREEWRLKFCVDWRNILLFDAFYRFLLCTRVPCFKPQWKPVGFDGLKTHRSPYVSGRWYLEV